MSRLHHLHNKTKVVAEGELPYNPTNVVVSDAELRRWLDDYGLRGVPAGDANVYRTAFVHRSYCTMKNADFASGNARCPPGCLPLQEVSYERLEFLGDAVLGAVVARYLYERYPDRDEGFLSTMRTKIVNGRSLGRLAEQLGFPRFIIMSKQIEDTQGRSNYKLGEDALEAFIGALSVEAGHAAADAWVTAVMERHIDFVDLVCAKSSHKEQLTRLMLRARGEPPQFFEMDVDARGGHRVFKYCVKDRAGAVLGIATGETRKQAENEAARVALETVFKE
jgi:ribonuclease-3